MGIRVDQEFFVELFARAKAGANDLNAAIGVVGIAHAEAAER